MEDLRVGAITGVAAGLVSYPCTDDPGDVTEKRQKFGRTASNGNPANESRLRRMHVRGAERKSQERLPRLGES